MEGHLSNYSHFTEQSSSHRSKQEKRRLLGPEADQAQVGQAIRHQHCLANAKCVAQGSLAAHAMHDWRVMNQFYSGADSADSPLNATQHSWCCLNVLGLLSVACSQAANIANAEVKIW